jgi:hypothetical protein
MANLSNINNKFLVTTTGEVLIGQTSNNGNRLQITGADGASYIYLKTDVATTGGRIGFNGDALRVFNQQASGELNLGTAGTTRLTINSAGIVKINTTAVNARFRVDEGRASEWVAGFKHTGTTPYGVFIDTSVNTSTGYTLGCYTNTGTGLFLKNDGNVGIGTTLPTAQLQIESTSAGAAVVAAFLVNESVTVGTETRLAFAANTNNDIATGRYSYISTINTSGSNGQAMTFATNETGASAVERMRIDSSGNVGIGTGTTTIAAKLHLEGTGDMIRIVKNVNNYGPQMDLILNQTSPSNGDTAGYINMGAKDNSGSAKYWGSIRTVVDNIFTEIGGIEFYTRAATDFNKRLKISAQGKVIVYQKDNVSGFYLDGGNTRLYANGGGGTDYRGIECSSAGIWSWGETGTSNYFATKVGIGTTSINEKLEVKGNIRIDSRSKLGSGEVDNITFTKDRPDASTGTYEMGAIRSFTTNGYSGGMRFYSGRHAGGGSYALIAALTIGDPANIGPAVVIKNGDSTSARIYPETDNAGYLGESTHRWQAVYAVNGSIQTSDRNQKTSITKSDLGLDFILKLEPVSYKWKVGGWDIKENGEDKEPTKTPIEGKRNHYGLIAQQVKEVIGDKDFGGWVKEDLEDEASVESLRYAEFISPMIKAIQELKADNDSLKARIETLENN